MHRTAEILALAYPLVDHPDEEVMTGVEKTLSEKLVIAWDSHTPTVCAGLPACSAFYLREWCGCVREAGYATLHLTISCLRSNCGSDMIM